MRQPNIMPIAVDTQLRRQYGISSEEAYQLQTPYEYAWTPLGGVSRKIVIPAGLVYDGASVPRLAWTLSGILPDGLIRAAALVHDFLYMNGGQLPEGSLLRLHADGVNWVPARNPFTRKVADGIFAKLMGLAGIPSWKVKLAYTAVRTFGWMAWGSRKGKRHVKALLDADPAAAEQLRCGLNSRP